MLEYFKEALAIAEKLKNQELLRKIVEAEAEALALQAENLRLKEETRKLSRQRAIEESLIFENNFYYLPPRTEGEERDGPFCSGCWDRRKETLVRLQLVRGEAYARNQPSYGCPSCGQVLSEDGDLASEDMVYAFGTSRGESKG